MKVIKYKATKINKEKLTVKTGGRAIKKRYVSTKDERTIRIKHVTKERDGDGETNTNIKRKRKTDLYEDAKDERTIMKKKKKT